MLYFLLILACREAQPVLQGIEEPGLLEDITPAAENRTEVKKAKVYAKANGVYIDVFYLGGRSFLETRGIIAEQFGDLQETTEVPMNLSLIHI